MALPPIVSVTLQSSILSASSNIAAQAITAYRSDKAFVVDWVPVFQFFLFTAVSTPPNFLWQDFLESTFPATKTTPTPAAIRSAATNDEKALDNLQKREAVVERKLHLGNTAAKFALDQTIGAAVNTLMFSVFMHSIQLAMMAGGGTRLDYGAVDWRLVMGRAQGEFWPIMSAGWKLWPFVSAFNFVVVKSVEMRNLVGALAGVVWGIYMSLVAAR